MTTFRRTYLLSSLESLSEAVNTNPNQDDTPAQADPQADGVELINKEAAKAEGAAAAVADKMDDSENPKTQAAPTPATESSEEAAAAEAELTEGGETATAVAGEGEGEAAVVDTTVAEAGEAAATDAVDTPVEAGDEAAATAEVTEGGEDNTEVEDPIDAAWTNAVERYRDLEPSTEGVVGGVLGFIGGGAAQLLGMGWLAGIGLSSAVKQKEIEIERLSKEIKRLSMDSAKEAIQEGKLEAKDLKKIDVPLSAIAWGAVNGFLFGGIYGAIKGHQLEDRVQELKEKTKEYEELLAKAVQEAKAKNAQASQENLEEGEAVSTTAEEGSAEQVPAVAEATGEEGTVDDAATSAEPVELTDEQIEAQITQEINDDGLASIPEDIAAVEEYVNDGLQQAEDVLDAVSEAEEVIEIVENGNGLDRTGAALLEKAVESFHARIGIPYNSAVVPSFESFGGTQARMQSTQIAVENFKERVQKVGERIMEIFNEIIARAAEFVQYVISRIGDVEEKLAEQQATLEGLKSSRDGKVMAPSIIKRLGMGGKLDANVSKQVLMVAKLIVANNELSKRRTSLLHRMAGQAVSNPKDFDQVVEDANELVSVDALPGVKTTSRQERKGQGNILIQESVSGFLPGHVRLKITSSTDMSGKVGDIKFKAEMEPVQANISNKEIRTLSVKEAIATVKAARELLKNIKEGQGLLDELKSVRGVIENGVKKAVNEAGKSEGASDVQDSARVYASAARHMLQPTLVLTSYSMGLVRDVSQFVNLTIKANKDAVAAKNAPAQQISNKPAQLAGA